MQIRPWPNFTLLVPLYREADIVAETIAAMSSLSYPRPQLEILFLLEADDKETRRAFEALSLPPHMKVVIVPAGFPRTKPRALCYGMRHASGDYISVYDAEDLPDPYQLQTVVRIFRDHPDCGCVQASLNIDNREKNWLTSQFSIEYSALFDCILPAFETWNLPIPLGGTSNHFPRSILDGVGSWDPYNVTEDADLGIRLARLGWRVRTSSSTTWEEAPTEFRSWLHQRTRWIKGWMQTYLVHMRDPTRTWRELGTKSFLGLQLLITSQVLSPLFHPWAIALTVANAVALSSREASDLTTAELVFVCLAGLNLLLGYGSGMALGLSAIRARGFSTSVREIVTMPVYWLLISIAAHRALVQLVAKPFLWEKTPHRGRRSGAGPGLA